MPNVTVPAGGRFVLCGDASIVPNCDLDLDPSVEIIRNGVADAIALYSGTSLVDSMSYGGIARGYTEGSAAPVDDPTVANAGLSRCPDGSDSNDNGSDFRFRPSTPGAANDCGSGNIQITGELCDSFSNLSYTVSGGPDQPLTGTIPASGTINLVVGGLSPGAYQVAFSGAAPGGKAMLGSANFMVVGGVTSTVLVGFQCAVQLPWGGAVPLLFLAALLFCFAVARLAPRKAALR